MNPVTLTIDPNVSGLKLGLVAASHMTIGPSSPSFTQWCATQVGEVLQQGMTGGESRREAVRAMLRAGGFKPAGRNKPAQEYLFRTLSEAGHLPAILNAVDALNVVSVRSGLPISLLASERIGPRSHVRYGRASERFVFNRAGQELDLEGLVCVCSDDGASSQPLGTPIKDSMLGKVTETDHQVMAVIYSPPAAVANDELLGWMEQLAAAFRQICPAAEMHQTLHG
jgi:DNA/RNA-binding domain of Phe-tRNA-synthetase-like protein